MTEKKPRSVFLPILIIGMLLIALFLFATLVPIKYCDKCGGEQVLLLPLGTTPETHFVQPCSKCWGKGALPILDLRGTGRPCDACEGTGIETTSGWSEIKFKCEKCYGFGVLTNVFTHAH